MMDSFTTEARTLSPSTTELMQRCRRGDSRAWQQLVDRYVRLVRGTAARHGLTETEIDDVGQEVFLALARNLAEIDDPERLPGWLATTTRRLCWRVVQQRRTEQSHAAADLVELETLDAGQALHSSMPTLQDLLDGWHRQELLTTALGQLAARCRKLLALIFLDPTEPSYADISRALNIPLGSIGPTRNRCLAKVRAILTGLGYDPTKDG